MSGFARGAGKSSSVRSGGSGPRWKRRTSGRAAAGCGPRHCVPDGTLEEDFVLRPGPHALHVVNAPSPAATASFAIAEQVVRAAGLT